MGFWDKLFGEKKPSSEDTSLNDNYKSYHIQKEDETKGDCPVCYGEGKVYFQSSNNGMLDWEYCDCEKGKSIQ